MGGRAFRGIDIGVQYEANTPPIKKEYIEPTMNAYFKVLKEIFKSNDKFNTTNFRPVGSVGKKPYSGDIDLAIDANSTMFNGSWAPENLTIWNIKPDTVTEADRKGWVEQLTQKKKPNDMKVGIIEKEVKQPFTFKDVERWAHIYLFNKRGFVGKYENMSKDEYNNLLNESRLRALNAVIVNEIQEYSFSHTDEPRIIVKPMVNAGNIFTGYTVINDNNEVAKVNEDTGAPDEDGDIAYAQIDWMIGKLDLLEFSYYSDDYKERNNNPDESKRDQVKGLHRTQLLIAMFSVVGFTYSHTKGLKRKERGLGSDVENLSDLKPGETTDDVNEILDILNKYYPGVTKENVKRYENLWAVVDKSKYRDDVVEAYLNILQSTRADIPFELREDWLAWSDYVNKYGPVTYNGKTIKHKEKPDGKYYTGKFQKGFSMEKYMTEDDKGKAIDITIKESVRQRLLDIIKEQIGE